MQTLRGFIMRNCEKAKKDKSIDIKKFANQNVICKKSGWIYGLCVFLWLIGVAVLVYLVYRSYFIFQGGAVYVQIISTISCGVIALCLSFFWLNSIKDILFNVLYFVFKNRILKKYQEVLSVKPKSTPKFALLYCTCNDFNEDALAECCKQDYENFEVVILDDSYKPEYKKRVDKFALENNLRVVRREDRKNFKAGNLNNYLHNNKDHDYFVVLDSDEIIPNNYCSEVLKYFCYSDNIGVVQANHTSTKPVNLFQKIMSISIKSSCKTVQVMKNFYGANALIGHGMTVSRECFDRIEGGGFPLVVAEDISFAVCVRKAGYSIAYAQNIICQEEFPSDYISLKKRQSKWTQGNIEYMKKFGKDINKLKLPWYEKLDTRLSHNSLPIVPILSILILICTFVLGSLNFGRNFNAFTEVYLICLFFLLSPIIPNAFVYIKTKNILLVIPNFLLNIIVYVSMLPMMLKTILLAIFGKKAKFIVTPKENIKIPLKMILLSSLDTYIFSFLVILFSILCLHSIWATLIISLPSLLLPFVIALSNIKIKKIDKIKKI